MPYSVSIPQTLGMATNVTLSRRRRQQTDTPRPHPGGRTAPHWSEIFTSADPLNGASPGCLPIFADQGTDIDDPLTLLPRDLGPVVGVGGVGKVLVLLVLLADGLQQVAGPDAAAFSGDGALDGQLLRPPHDVLDHGPRSEVPVVQDLLVTVLIGDLEKAVLVVVPVHLADRGLDDRLGRLGRIAPAQRLDLLGIEGEIGGEVAGEDLG